MAQNEHERKSVGPSSPWQNYGECASGDEACGNGKKVPSAGQPGE
jgi:hypothetical protein